MKRIIILILVLFTSQANAQLSELLRALTNGDSVLYGSPSTGASFWTSFTTLSESTDSLMASLQDYGQSIDNYADVATALTDANNKSGLLIIPKNSTYCDSTINTTGYSLTVFNFCNGTFEIDFAGTKDEIAWDVIAWFPPADSGAVLDTLDNQIEVLSFYDATDSVNAYNTWQMTYNFTEIDSIELLVLAPNTDGDSVAFRIWGRFGTEGEVLSASAGAEDYEWTLYGADTVDLGTDSLAIKRLVIATDFGSLAADDILDLRLVRLNTITNNVAAAVALRRTRIFYK